MKRPIATILLTIGISLLIGCPLYWEDRRLHREYDIPYHGFEHPDFALGWVYDNITYESEPEGRDYWQTPEFTYVHRTGDCEDMTILWMYFMVEEMGFSDVYLVAGIMPEGSGHAMGYHNGWFYEPTCNWRTETIAGWWLDERYRLDYEEAIQWALRKGVEPKEFILGED